jgi:hypothetical protein
VALVIPVLRLCRSCRGRPTFGETAVGGLLSSSPGSGLPRWKCQPAAGTAGPPGGAGFLSSSRGDSWDASRQIARHVACPISHPHDSRPKLKPAHRSASERLAREELGPQPAERDQLGLAKQATSLIGLRSDRQSAAGPTAPILLFIC